MWLVVWDYFAILCIALCEKKLFPNMPNRMLLCKWRPIEIEQGVVAEVSRQGAPSMWKV